MTRDEDLLLYHYGEGLDSAARAAIAAVMATDPNLTVRLHQLLADLEFVASQEPTGAVSAATRTRWRNALDTVAATERLPRARLATSTARHWRVGVAVCATLVLGIVIGTHLDRPQLATPVAVADRGGDDARFERGLSLHLAETQLQLVQMADADGPTRAQLLSGIIEQNRLFERAAERAGENKLARVLRSFDSLLLTMDDPSLDAQSLEDQRAQFGFELDVMQTKLAQASSNSTL